MEGKSEATAIFPKNRDDGMLNQAEILTREVLEQSQQDHGNNGERRGEGQNVRREDKSTIGKINSKPSQDGD